MLKKLRSKRARLIREAGALKGRDGSFASDEARASFDAKMTEVETIDQQIRDAEGGPSETLDAGAAAETRDADDVDEDDDEQTPAEAARDAERSRINGIWLACRTAKMTAAFAQKLIDDNVPLEDAQSRVFKEWGKRADTSTGPHPSARPDVRMGDDPLIHKRAGIENALLHRVNPDRFKLEDVGREYRGMSVLDIAKTFLQARGVRITDMGRMEIAGLALGLTQRGGMHSTSDFPLLLADVAHKSLRAEYDVAPQTFEPITRRGTVPDFRASNRVQIGDAPSLKPVSEHGEFTRGSMEEAREQVQAATYGRVFAITRQALVNDDLDAFSRVPTKFGRMAKNLESDLVWYQILKNANMSDSNALFSVAHLNFAGAGDISVTQVAAAERAMMLQTGLDGTTLINAVPKYLIVGPTKKTRAMQFVSTTLQATTQANVNPYAGQLQVIVEPRLEAGITIGTLSATGAAHAWYLAADKNVVDIVELVFLEGQSGPVLESRVGFDIDGLEIKCRHDVGAKALDWRGVYKSAGTESS
jgi:phage major head subunit gpT-like protein